MHTLINETAEKTLLGCVLSDPLSLFRVLALVRPEDFALDSHRRIFRVAVELAGAGKPVDVLTVTNAFGTNGQLEAVGGVEYVADLSRYIEQDLARVTNVEHYAHLVVESSRRRRARSAAERLSSATEDPTISTDECLQQVQEALLEIEAASQKSAAKHVKDLMPEVMEELYRQAKNKGLVGMPTGLPSLDVATGGIRPGELWTIGALPGKGKTALGVQMILANSAAGIPTYAFSLEMHGLEIGKRFLAAQSTLPAMQIRNPQTIRGERWEELAEVAARIAKCPIYIDDRPTVKIQELLASARLYIRRHQVQLVVVDYLRLVEAPGRELRERVAYVANALRQLAKSERVGVVLLSQLRRPENGMNSRPTMLDLKESGDTEAHSHVVLLPYLPIAEDGGPKPEEQLLIIGKSRNGAVGSLPVYFDEKHLQFRVRIDSRKEAQ
jgi:replicative DNA helicase